MKTKTPDAIASAVSRLRSSLGPCTIEVLWDSSRNEPWNPALGPWSGDLDDVRGLRSWARKANARGREIHLHGSRGGADCDELTFTL